MIARNEEANLADCLRSAIGLADETIVVDTGSTDRTKEVAIGLGAKVYDFDWADDFAAARNVSLAHAGGDWIFWLDADDRIDQGNHCKLQSLFAGLKDENVAYLMKSRSAMASGPAIFVEHVRLFLNRPDIRWQYRIHEQVMPAILRLGGSLRATDIVIVHAGYEDAVRHQQKHERNLRLLQLDLADRPNDADVLFYLGGTLLALGRPAEALPWLRRSLEFWSPATASASRLYPVLVDCLYKVRENREALAICRQGRNRYPNDGDLLYYEGVLLDESGDHRGAETQLVQLLDMLSDMKVSLATDIGPHGNLLRRKLTGIYAAQGRHVEAETQWRRILATQPGAMDAWMGLADAWLAQDRWQELENAIRELEADRRPVPAAILRARLHLARAEFQAARQVLERAILRSPRAAYPRLMLGDVLLQEGRDPAGAEQVWRDLLALQPNYAPAQQRLATLLQQQGPTG
jgi:tetratricopeptide (TPR) repeat protein